MNREASDIRTPLLLMGAVLLFWGWQTGLLLQGVLMGAGLEASRLVTTRLRIQAKDYSRLLDVCILLVLGLTLFLYLTPMRESELLVLVRWLPMAFYPLPLAEAYGEGGRARFSGILYTVRPKRRLESKPPLALQVSFIYALVCLFAAGAANTRDVLFYPSMAILVVWGLMAVRPRRHAGAVWLLAACMCIALAYLGQWGVHEVQQAVRDWVRFDPLQRSTAIGDIGQVKLSDRIKLRVRTSEPLAAPLLLREASYNYFAKETWHATNGEFEEVPPLPSTVGNPVEQGEDTPRSWPATLTVRESVDPGQDRNRLEIYQYVPRRRRLLPLPLDAMELHGLVAENVSVSPLGGVLVRSVTGLVSYSVAEAADATGGSPPTAVDKIVPLNRKLLKEIVANLDLQGLPEGQKALRIQEYFLENFSYSLDLERTRRNLPPLEEFLAHTRKGHCEFFALAAVYALRTAGIPARYAVGYAVSEYSPIEDLYVARGSHAHAWALAWLDGRWTNLDATPPVWLAEDVQEQNFFSRMADWRQYLVFAFSQWRWLGGETTLKRVLLWVVPPLLLFLIVRLARQHSIRRHGGGVRTSKRSGPFAQVEKRLRKEGWKRSPSEPWTAFLHRAGASSLEPALRLYYQGRFDPRGAPPELEGRLAAEIQSWLKGR